MPNDILTLSILCNELNYELLEGKITSVYFSEKDCLCFEIFKKSGQKRYLIFSMNNLMPLFFTNTTKPIKQDNPISFIMLLKKYLLSSKILSIKMMKNDRILEIEVIQQNELYDRNLLKIIFEISSLKSNLILVNSEGTIIGALKSSLSKERLIILGEKYSSPERIPLLDINSITYAFGKTTKIEYEYLKKEIGEESANEFFTNLLNNKQDNLYPCIFLKNGKVVDFFIYPYKSLMNITDAKFEYYSNLSLPAGLFINSLYPKQDKTSIYSPEIKYLKKLIKSYKFRLSVIEENITKTPLLLSIKAEADLLKCNLHLVPKRAMFIDCYDYSKDQNVKIHLEPSLSPSDNLQNIYKKYNKLKATIDYSRQEESNIRNSISHLESLLFSLSLSNDKSDIFPVLKELNEEYHYHKFQSIKPINILKASDNYLKLNYEGYKILVGKNNIQNDNITFKIANKNDIWLHVNGAPGSHTVILGGDNTIPLSIIEKAASFAAYYSSKNNDTSVSVNYTFIKNIKRGKLPGMVFLSKNNCISVTPKAPILSD